MTGLVTLSLAASVAAILTGLLAGFVAQWFYLVVLFPIGMGVGIGMVGSLAVKQGKVRMPLVCGGAGFLAGCLAVAAMHYFEYQSFETQMQEVPEGVRQVAKNFDKLQAERDKLPAEIQELLDEIGKDPEARKTLAIDGLVSHLDFKAHQGVMISKRGRGGINLGYTGSYIYWGVELLMIAGFAFVAMRGAADEPFCSQCESWKQQETLGSFGASAEKARTALESGDLPELGANMGSSGDLIASKFQCPQCGASAPVEVRLEKITINAKGGILEEYSLYRDVSWRGCSRTRTNL